jgi:hypothetical protein
MFDGKRLRWPVIGQHKSLRAWKNSPIFSRGLRQARFSKLVHLGPDSESRERDKQQNVQLQDDLSFIFVVVSRR